MNKLMIYRCTRYGKTGSFKHGHERFICSMAVSCLLEKNLSEVTVILSTERQDETSHLMRVAVLPLSGDYAVMFLEEQDFASTNSIEGIYNSFKSALEFDMKLKDGDTFYLTLKRVGE